MIDVIERPSPNFDGRDGMPVSILMIHYTGMTSGAAALARLRDAAAKVSSHYLIEEDGTVFRLVAEADRAWHAGAGSWRGLGDVNARSIGIELVNPGHEWGYRPFPAAQMSSLAALGRDILARHAIAPFDVIGHSDSAPARKTDPGELFDWRWLAGEGVGFWEAGTDPAPADPAGLAEDLAAFGYGFEGATLADVLAAFQRHWRPARVDGRADDETRGRLAFLSRRLRETGFSARG
ncbi:N-acetylmuramoyl-L-alanine amidase [Zavarzinia compransoris]|uniref:N-acetylmuramoyl-L-alanine amidase n=1 Tax=Zavarzinia marina TaxID=2911065 RepID=UPI001F17B755|nr:N-acetylmuramoyl-L-alanine amidase [Zavarzinia marina]MCF4167091.1 N-acetylmuramoyl-L-alanine amidase [Zavarzinia marina]